MPSAAANVSAAASLHIRLSHFGPTTGILVPAFRLHHLDITTMGTTRRWNTTAHTKDTKVTKDTKASRFLRPNETSYKVIGVALKVHSGLGAGLLESAYDGAFCNGLTKAGLHFQ